MTPKTTFLVGIGLLGAAAVGLVAQDASAGRVALLATRRCVSPEGGTSVCHDKDATAFMGLTPSVGFVDGSLVLVLDNTGDKPITFAKSYACTGLTHVAVNGRSLPGGQDGCDKNVPEWVTVAPGGRVPIKKKVQLSASQWRQMKKEGVTVTFQLERQNVAARTTLSTGPTAWHDGWS